MGEEGAGASLRERAAGADVSARVRNRAPPATDSDVVRRRAVHQSVGSRSRGNRPAHRFDRSSDLDHVPPVPDDRRVRSGFPAAVSSRGSTAPRSARARPRTRPGSRPFGPATTSPVRPASTRSGTEGGERPPRKPRFVDQPHGFALGRGLPREVREPADPTCGDRVRTQPVDSSPGPRHSRRAARWRAFAG